jgi:hypothetical protein
MTGRPAAERDVQLLALMDRAAAERDALHAMAGSFVFGRQGCDLGWIILSGEYWIYPCDSL